MSNIITSLNASMVAITASTIAAFFAVIAMVLSLRVARLLSQRVAECERNISDLDAEIRDLSPDQSGPVLGRE
jgi:hypothetical protein